MDIKQLIFILAIALCLYIVFTSSCFIGVGGGIEQQIIVNLALDSLEKSDKEGITPIAYYNKHSQNNYEFDKKNIPPEIVDQMEGKKNSNFIDLVNNHMKNVIQEYYSDTKEDIYDLYDRNGFLYSIDKEFIDKDLRKLFEEIHIKRVDENVASGIGAAAPAPPPNMPWG